MGLTNWLLKKAAKKALKNKDSVSNILTDELKSTTKDYKNLLKEAEEVQKLRVMRDRVRKLKDTISEADEDEFEEEDEEEEEESGMLDGVIQNLIKTYAEKALTNQSSEGGVEKEIIDKLTPEQLEKIKGFLQ